MGTCKYMEPGGIQPRVFKQLVDVITRPCSIIFQQSYESREVPVDWKLTLFHFSRARKKTMVNRLDSLTSAPEKVMLRGTGKTPDRQ